MAKTADRKLEVAREIHRLACEEHGLDPELLIFDALTFTLTTGDEEWRPSAVETIEGIRRIKAELPGVKTSLGVSNVSFGISPAARAVLNSVVPAPLRRRRARPRDGQPEPHHAVRGDPRARSGSSPTTSSSTAPTTPSSGSSPISRARIRRRRPPRPAIRPREWSPRRRSTTRSSAARRTGVEEWIDRSVEKIGAVPTLNTVLLPAMKEVGDKFGAGELILPFVLQSAEVMKRAVAQLENYLDRIEGHTKGTVVIATVFGDVHDIGKSLVNTILTNNGYTVVDLGKQVPIEQIIDAAVDHEADAIGLSALLVSTSKQMPACIQELHQRGLDFPVLIGGAAINRDFGRRALYPNGRESDEIYEPGRLLLQGRLRRARHGRRADRRRGARRRSSRRSATRRRRCARSPSSSTTRRRRPTTRSARRSRTTTPIPAVELLRRPRRRRRPRRGLPVPRPPRPLQAPLGRPRRQGRGVAEDRRGRRRGGGLRRQARADVGRAGLPPPEGADRLLPVQRRRQRAGRLRPRPTPSASSSGSSSRASPSTTGSASADFFRPIDSGERDVVALQGVTAGSEVTEADRAARARRRVRRAALHPRPRRPVGRGARRVAACAGARGARHRTAPRAAATRGAIRPARSSPSTRRSGDCSGSRRSG